MFKFINEYDNYFNTSNVFKIDNINNKEDLFSVYNEELKFPKYFGFNWDALRDCLCDLNWLEANHLALVHSTLKELDDNSRKIYLDILIEVIEVWEKDGGKRIDVFFLKKDQSLIKS